ncbi:phosphoribosylpyrophosphate synthetase [Solitalea koreensis]|uniref:Uncharacterized protein n=1 Tax=Solitalea koreensis TaxID=543615 RepID=A0A521AGQ4_9SPHI|nr:phosphoribosylpyrophosphate synthetase [Solitalea koreensis]SMO33982.1 hypothetical protein SAMN06265350_101147 [Solitalea koreensis]
MKKLLVTLKHLAYLTSEGYKDSFELVATGIKSLTTGAILSHEHFTIKAYYKIDGIKDPKDASLVYAIETMDGLRGALITAYSAFNEIISPDLIKKLALHPVPVNVRFNND